MAKVYKTTFKLRRGNSFEWAQVNPVLAIGEPAFEVDTFKLKIGNGSLPYNSLPYIADANALYSGNKEDSIVFVETANHLPRVGETNIFYAVIEDKVLMTWDTESNDYVSWGISQSQATNIQEKITNLLSDSVYKITMPNGEVINSEENTISIPEATGDSYGVVTSNDEINGITYENGKGSVDKLSIDTLYQQEEYNLILYGGDSTN